MVKIVVKLDKAQAKLSPQSRQAGQYTLANQALSNMNPYVPKKNNILSMSGTVNLDGSAINYNTPYAKAQFYGIVNGYRVHRYTTPGTGRRWDLRAKSKHMSDWKRAYIKGAGL